MLGAEQDRAHSISSRSREGIRIEGVNDVLSFDDRGVSLDTLCGGMGIEGEGLRVKTLNTENGIVEIEGRINGVYYFDEKPTAKRGLFSRKVD